MKLALIMLVLSHASGADLGANAPETSKTPSEIHLNRLEQELAQQLLRDLNHSEKTLIILGDYFEQRGKTDQALAYWQRALQANPHAAPVYDRMAKLAFATDDWERSTGLWQKAIQINPSLSNLHNSLARSLMQLGRYEEARDAVQQERRVSGANVPSYLLLGAVDLELGNYEEARQSYKKILELDPNAMHAYYGLYQVFTRLQDQTTARKHLAEFQRHKNAWRKTKQQTSVRNMGRHESPAAFHARCLAQLCADAQTLYEAQGDQRKVEQLLRRAVELAPKGIAHHTRLMSFYASTGRVREALRVCEIIKELDPNSLSCQLNLGRLCVRLDQIAPAEAAFQEAIRMAPDKPHGYRELAQIYLRTPGRQHEARNMAVKALALESNARHFFLLGWAHDVAGQRDKAIAALRQAVKLNPRNQTYQRALQGLIPKETRK